MSLPSLTFQVIKIPNTTVPTTWAHIQAGFPAPPPKPLLMSPKWKLTWIVLYPYNFRVWLLEQLIIIILTDPVFNLARSMSSNTISYQVRKGFKEMLFFFFAKNFRTWLCLFLWTGTTKRILSYFLQIKVSNSWGYSYVKKCHKQSWIIGLTAQPKHTVLRSCRAAFAMLRSPSDQNTNIIFCNPILCTEIILFNRVINILFPLSQKAFPSICAVRNL